VGRSLAAYCGNNVFLDVALGWVVARRDYCPVMVRGGEQRPSGYTLAKLAQHFLRLVLTSGTRLLRLIAVLGVVSLIVAGAITVGILFRGLASTNGVQPWTATIIVMCFFGGCILVSLAIIAEYLGAALSMAMGKPLYIVVSRPERRKQARG
jgi:undecaprenyl-phosphate 4-deoxy-4-formamido-L-arabinose transferase